MRAARLITRMLADAAAKETNERAKITAAHLSRQAIVYLR